VPRQLERVTPLEAPRDSTITRVACRDTREANNYGEHIREYNSAVAFASVGAGLNRYLEIAHIVS
jgi:hypothetical protein